jgi:putative ABC transport system permease protein
MINIVSLTIGFTSFLLMALFVLDELSYDRSVEGAEDIYRVQLSDTGNGTVVVYPDVDVAVGKGMKDVIPEIEAFTRIIPVADFVRYHDKQFREQKLAFADSNFLQMFSIPLLEGDARQALSNPNSIVVSREFAVKYFGSAEPLGKSLVIGLNNAAYTVTGVFDRVPRDSHFHFDGVLSLSTRGRPHGTWSNLGFFTYVRLRHNSDPANVEAKFPALVQKYVVPEVQHDMGVPYVEALNAVNTFRFSLLPLTRIHLYSHTRYEIEPNGDIQEVYIFALLALFVLLLACVNFTNLSTARAATRAKEIGIRKVMGSGRAQLVQQLLSESVLLSVCAMGVAVAATVELLPALNALSGKNITTGDIFNPLSIIAAIVLSVIVGMLAGIYPAFFLSSFSPIRVIKRLWSAKEGSVGLRSSLIVFQFLVSVGLMTATIVADRQLEYMQNKKLGFDKEQVLFLPEARLLGAQQTVFKEQVLRDHRVQSASISRSVPGSSFMDGTEIFGKNGPTNGPEIHANIFHVDDDYIRTLGIRIKEGRGFSREFPADSAGVVINEAAVRELGWGETNAVGKRIVTSGQHDFKVIGVVADFNYASVRQRIAPLMLVLGRNAGGLVLKVTSDGIPGLLHDLKKEWDAMSPAGPFTFEFVDQEFAALYTSEEKTQSIFAAFATLAIVIAALGLFGLSAFVVQQRTKEIGIRKTLGASVFSVLYLLTKDFARSVVVATLLAWPVAWFAMHTWLEGFAYRIEMRWWMFVLSGVIALSVALMTISVHVVRAATANPVEALKYE